MADKDSTNDGKNIGFDYSRELPIKHVIPDDLRATHSNHVTVQLDGNDGSFQISFFEIRPPLVLGSPEERKTALDKIESAQAMCLQRIVITKKTAKGLLAALGEQIARAPLRAFEKSEE